MKHLALDLHFVQENVNTGTLGITHISGNDQLTDLLTKPLPRARFVTLLSKIGLFLRPSILREHLKDIDIS